MSQKIENLSALVDGEELESSSFDYDLLDDVKNDAELMQKWKNYHLIRHGLRQELPAEINFDIAAQVSQALESEPAILAPKRTWRDLPVIGNVVPLVKQGGQMAVAASVAVAVIIGVQQFNQPELEQPFNAAPPIPGIQGGLSPVSFEQSHTPPRADAAEQTRRINAYLSDHKQQMRFKTILVPQNETSKANKNTVIDEAQSEVVENTPE